jgi:hypothetical protein
VRNLGTNGYCADHLAALYATFDPVVFALHGVGLPATAEGGAGERLLSCNACGAGWWGLAGEECTWCFNAWQRLLEHQGELALTPPGVDPDDITYDQQIDGWGQRLWVAVLAGLVDERAATRAWQRAVQRGAVRTPGPVDEPVPAAAGPERPRFRPPGAGRADHHRLVRRT